MGVKHQVTYALTSSSSSSSSSFRSWLSPWYNRTGWMGVKHQVTYAIGCLWKKMHAKISQQQIIMLLAEICYAFACRTVSIASAGRYTQLFKEWKSKEIKKIQSQKDSNECLFILTRTHLMPIFREIPFVKPQTRLSCQQPSKHWISNKTSTQKGFPSHFSSFLTVHFLSKGISKKTGILCVRVKINKRSFEPFCVWILF